MSFGDHLEDLRKRVMLALLGIVPIFAVSMVFGAPILEFILLPARNALRAAGLPPHLQATSPLETFGAYFKVAFVMTVVVGAPWVVFQLWRFVSPGLYKKERRFAYILAPMSSLLSILGAAFMYTVMLPVIMTFFIRFGSTFMQMSAATDPLPEGVTLPVIPVLAHDPIDPAPGSAWVNADRQELRFNIAREGQPPVVLGTPLTKTAAVLQQYKISEYLGLVLGLGLAFGIGFQMPIVVLLLGWVGIVEREAFMRYRKQAVMGCAILGAVLTPADPFSMVLLAVPLYLLYEFGVLLLKYMTPERIAGREADGDADE